MFPSNIEFTLTGSLDQLQYALDATLKLYGIQDILSEQNLLRKYPAQLGFSKHKNPHGGNIYRLVIVHENDPKTPTDRIAYPFRYDLDILSKIITQWLKDQTHAVNERDPVLNYDGSVERGFKITVDNDSVDHTIVCNIEPFLCFYAK